MTFLGWFMSFFVLILLTFGVGYYSYSCFFHQGTKPSYCNSVLGWCYRSPKCEAPKKIVDCKCVCDKECLNGGTIDPETCKCTCPDDYSGDACENHIPTTQDCKDCNVQMDNNGTPVLCPIGYTTDQSSLVADYLSGSIECSGGKCNRCFGKVYPDGQEAWKSFAWKQPTNDSSDNIMAYVNPGKSDQYCTNPDDCTYVSNTLPIVARCHGCESK
jgi:hypothetical protein